MRKSTRWKRKNRHKNISLFNAFKDLESMPYREGRYVSYDPDMGVVIKRTGCLWSYLPYHHKAHKAIAV